MTTHSAFGPVACLAALLAAGVMMATQVDSLQAGERDTKSNADQTVNDIKIGNKSQFVQSGRKKAAKPVTVSRGRPQTVQFKTGRY